MGNQETKTSKMSCSTAETDLPQHSHLFSNRFNDVTKNGETELTSELLQSTVFQGLPALSLVIYRSLQTPQNCTNKSQQPDRQEVPAGEEAPTPDNQQPENQKSASDGESKTVDGHITERTFVEFASEVNQKQSFQEHVELFFRLFASGMPGLNEQGCTDLLYSCCISGLVLCGCQHSDEFGNQSTGAAVRSMLALASEDGFLRKDQFQSWIQKHCPRLFDPLHTLVCHRLRSRDYEQATATSQSEMVLELLSNKYLLSVVTLYLLSCQLSPGYFPSTTSSHMDQLSASMHLPLNSVLQGGWHVLYNSNAQGLSINRFQHHVFQYKAPTVTLIAFEGHVYCLCISEEWKEDSKFRGGSECSLIQIEPQLNVIQSGADMMFLNWSQRSLPKGLQIGSQGRSRVLELDGEFSSVKHYGIELPLHRIEVWGCGGEAVLTDQQKQRAWEKKDTQKHRDRKLKIDDWEDSPDRQLLEWGGVKTRHDERM